MTTCDDNITCIICGATFKRERRQGRPTNVCSPGCKVERHRRSCRITRVPATDPKPAPGRPPASSPSACPGAPARQQPLGRPLTRAQVAASLKGYQQPFAQGTVLPACPNCLRLRIGRDGTTVAGYLLCMKDEMGAKPQRGHAPTAAAGRAPVIVDERGDAPAYWMRPDVAWHGSARACRYFLSADQGASEALPVAREAAE